MQQTGIEGQQVVLLLEDYQFVDVHFLELVNSLLSAGEVAGLYTPEELEPLLAPLRNQALEAGFRGTILQYFAARESISADAFINCSTTGLNTNSITLNFLIHHCT